MKIELGESLFILGSVSAPQASALSLVDVAFSELKIGKVVHLVMKPILESSRVSNEELLLLQDK